MSAQFWFAAVTTLVVVAYAVRSVLAEQRSVRAQHQAHHRWETTGETVPGWSHHWIWSAPTSAYRPVAQTVEHVIVHVVHHLHRIQPPTPRATEPAASPVPIEGRIVAALPPALTRTTGPRPVRWASVGRAFTRAGGGSR